MSLAGWRDLALPQQGVNQTSAEILLLLYIHQGQTHPMRSHSGNLPIGREHGCYRMLRSSSGPAGGGGDIRPLHRYHCFCIYTKGLSLQHAVREQAFFSPSGCCYFLQRTNCKILNTFFVLMDLESILADLK